MSRLFPQQQADARVPLRAQWKRWLPGTLITMTWSWIGHMHGAQTLRPGLCEVSETIMVIASTRHRITYQSLSKDHAIYTFTKVRLSRYFNQPKCGVTIDFL